MTSLLKKFGYYYWEETSQLSHEYLAKYWIREEELKNWGGIKNQVFNPLFVFFPDDLFTVQFEMLACPAGQLFTRESFDNLKHCMVMAGDQFFAILEHPEADDPFPTQRPLLNFAFPASITWEEYMLGDGRTEGITYELNRPVRNFFVIGDSCKWGKYVANDYIKEIEIYGFHDSISKIFNEKFPITQKEKEDLLSIIPPKYLSKMGW